LPFAGFLNTPRRLGLLGHFADEEEHHELQNAIVEGYSNHG
jgi:hypothetical protein